MRAATWSAPVVLLVISCGGGAGAPAEAVAPETRTAEEALGETTGECRADGLANGGNPLIIDWNSTERADLEVLMADGVAVVRFSCDKGVELLTECTVSGDYGYRGVSVKSTTLSLKNADEVSANLTGGGAGAGRHRRRAEAWQLASARLFPCG